MGVEIQGAEQLQALARRLESLAQTGLRDELDGALREGLRSAGPAVHNAALRTLPRRGGLNRLVADRIKVQAVTLNAGVRLTAKGSRELDRGSVRHPVFGDRTHWVTEHVHPGFWTGTLSNLRDELHRDVAAAVDRVEKKAEP